MRRILPALLWILAAAPALAAEPDAKGGAPGTNIDMPYLMAPMNGADEERRPRPGTLVADATAHWKSPPPFAEV